MPFQILDLILFGIMLVSGLLALMRGFTREVLSLVAWAAAALATYIAVKQPALVALAIPYVEKPILAQIAVGAIVFIVVLIVFSLVGVKVSDKVVDSSAGAFDRSLGFVYGLGRGFVLITVAYLFYGWLVPLERQEDWVRNARSLPLIKSAAEIMLSYMPPDIAETLTNTALMKSPGLPAGKSDNAQSESGYQGNETQGLDNLIQGTGEAQQPAFGQSGNQ
jgi:membrane protein required for colicin V production